jgi:hypothetical protein
MMETVTRTNLLGDRTAVYSTPDESYRYKLTIDLGSGEGTMLFIGLNPSTATELDNDPTIERVERRAREMGFRTLVVCNIFAYRATDPEDMLKADEPIGGYINTQVLLEAAEAATLVLCGWGRHGSHHGRGKLIEMLLRQENLELYSLGTNMDKSPKHPLYLGYWLKPEVWEELGETA